MTRTSTTEILRIARQHVAASPAYESSARLCLADAIRLEYDGDLDRAAKRALDSLRYSIGILHRDYARASRGRELG